MKTLRIHACTWSGETPPVKIVPWKGATRRVTIQERHEKVRQDARDMASWMYHSGSGMWVQALTDELKRLEEGGLE